MIPEIPSKQASDASNDSPFFGALVDDDIRSAVDIMTAAVEGHYPQIKNGRIREEWAEKIYQIEKLGNEHGRNVLKVLNIIAVKDGLTLIGTNVVINMYCKEHELQVPPPRPQPQTTLQTE